MTSETNEFVRQLLNQMQEEMTKEYFKQESTTSPERLKVLEADAKMRLCTVHHLAPENVDVSGHETSPGTYTFTVTERIPVSTFTIPTNFFHPLRASRRGFSFLVLLLLFAFCAIIEVVILRQPGTPRPHAKKNITR